MQRLGTAFFLASIDSAAYHHSAAENAKSWVTQQTILGWWLGSPSQFWPLGGPQINDLLRLRNQIKDCQNQGWVNSIPELELQLNSNSNSGIGIEIGGIENGIGIETPGIGIGIGIENRKWIFATATAALTS